MWLLKFSIPFQKMKAIQTKSKGKKRNGKLKKVKLSNRDINNRITSDLSSLRKPVDISISALHQVNKLLEDGTDEVKSILSYECDIIYECRICRSLFRSILNLISHKREYCREKFNITLHRSVLNDRNVISTKSIIHMCKTGQTIIKENAMNDRVLRSQVPKNTTKKDLTTIIEMLNKKRQENTTNSSSNILTIESPISDIPKNQHIYLEPIDTNNSAVYQTVKSPNRLVDTTDLIKGQLTELQDVIDQNTITLEEHTNESQLEKSDSPIQVDMSDEENQSLIDKLHTDNLICTICNAKFSTRKTLTFHMKTLHTSQRMCYSCPCCTNTFANTWSVHRHLLKVHKKTNEQVRELRSHIQEKVFHEGTIMMKDLETTHATITPALENITKKSNDKTHEWINHSAFNEERQICIRCGKKFDRKAALVAHSYYCQASRTVCKKVATKIRRSNKALTNSTLNTLCEIKDTNAVINNITIASTDKNNTNMMNSRETTSSTEIIDEYQKSSIRIQSVSTLNKEEWDMLENCHDHLSRCNSANNNNDLAVATSTQNIDDNKSISFNKNQDHFELNKNSQFSSIVCTNTNETSPMMLKIRKKRGKISCRYVKKRLAKLKDTILEKDIIERQENDSRLQPSCSIPNETEQILPMENKIATIANFQKLQCLLCKRKFTSATNLRRHIAIHIGWHRYRCKLCDFKCFVKYDCIAHCNKVHDTQNNHAAIAQVIAEIPQNEYKCNENIIMDVTNTEGKVDLFDNVGVPASPNQMEIYKECSNTDTCVTLQNKVIANEQVIESRNNIEYENIDMKDNIETTEVKSLAEYMMSRGSGKLDSHPDLKQIVMEVIFGSSNVSATE